MIFSFSDSGATPLAEVGGKGYSLIRMFQHGLSIPRGFVLTVSFFEPWFATLKATDAWHGFASASGEQRGAYCRDLKASCAELSLDPQQRKALEDALAPFRQTDETLFAVRSSSPEEDLEGASFAGGYETVLGVTLEILDDAIRRAFASCLDERIVIYKEQNGFSVLDPRIAVVVQRQIASEVAGVGFSVNPINNDYDEAVFSANWGLGETVVSGTASPDLFVVDKVARQLLDRTTGAKETSLWLTPTGGTEERPDPRHDQLTLSDAEVLELAEQIVGIEQLYDKPMDIEFAFAGGKLYLLQARPITTHVPVPAAMQTTPGERRRLYLDVTISVQGLFEPLSVMATSTLQSMLATVIEHIFKHDITADIETTVPIVTDGRIYLNISNLLHIASKEKIASFFENFDPLASGALLQCDESQYRSEKFSKQLSKWGLLKIVSPAAVNVIESRLMPDRAHQSCQRHIEAWHEKVTEIAKSEAPLVQYATALLTETVQLVFKELIPLLLIARRSVAKIEEFFADDGDEAQTMVDALSQSLPGNITVEMGLTLYDLSLLLDVDAPSTADSLAKAIASNDASVSHDFRDAWSSFLDRYGHRANTELDIAMPRYREDPGVLLQQILQLRTLEPQKSPRALFERSKAAREKSFEQLAGIAADKGWITSKRFKAFYHIVERLGGYREAHKFYVVQTIDLLRTRLLHEANNLVEAGRLDHVNDIFDLTLVDVDKALADSSVDLRALAVERRGPIDRMARVPQLPRVVDSRGRIHLPPPPVTTEGWLVGHPISAGVVQGPVKVLNTPDEKPLLAGEILVARATDPGWTPLFVNAGGIILEVGGVLQHGALVAREYGKPCVAGIQNATTELTDGTVVEVDGSTGMVRLL